MSKFKKKLQRLFKEPTRSDATAFPPRDLDRRPLEVDLTENSPAQPRATTDTTRSMLANARQDAGREARRPLRRVRLPDEADNAPTTPTLSPERAAAREILSARLSRQARVQKHNDAAAPGSSTGTRPEERHQDEMESERDRQRAARSERLSARSFEAWRKERSEGSMPASQAPAMHIKGGSRPENAAARTDAKPPQSIGADVDSAPNGPASAAPRWRQDPHLAASNTPGHAPRPAELRTLVPSSDIAHTSERSEEDEVRAAEIRRQRAGKKDAVSSNDDSPEIPQPDVPLRPKQEDWVGATGAGQDDSGTPLTPARKLARAIVNRGRLSDEESAALLNEALDGLLAETDRRRALRELATIEEGRGNLQLCVLAWQELTRISSHDPQPHLELARLFERHIGDPLQALAHAVSALELAPWNDVAHRLKRRLQRECRNEDDGSTLH